MKLALVVFALALAPLAIAQPFPSSCKFYEDLIAVAPVKFESFRAAKLGPDTYASTLRPVRYPKCLVGGRSESVFACLGNPGRESLIRALYNDERERIRKCLPSWETAPLLDADGPAKSVDGLRFIQRTTKGDVTISVGLYREKAGERLYRMTFGVIWLPTPLGV